MADESSDEKTAAQSGDPSNDPTLLPARGRRRPGFFAMAASSLAIGLSLWLHYSVDGRADSFAAIAVRALTAANEAEHEYFQKNKEFTGNPERIREHLKLLHTGPYLLFLNPGCPSKVSAQDKSKDPAPEGTKKDADNDELFTAVINKTSLKRVPHENSAGLAALFSSQKICPSATSGYLVLAAGMSKKTGEWDIWQTDEKAKITRIRATALPPTRAHRIKQIALVLLVLGAVGLSSILLPRIFYRFFIRPAE